LLDAVGRGEEVEITNRGRVVARLVGPRSPAVPRAWGIDEGRITVSQDFDAPLPDELAAAFGLSGPDTQQ
jgi:antitoxin (DNA-binding transcriptional repressor) of toxin-antitoxin stability system